MVVSSTSIGSYILSGVGGRMSKSIDEQILEILDGIAYNQNLQLSRLSPDQYEWEFNTIKSLIAQAEREAERRGIYKGKQEIFKGQERRAKKGQDSE